MRLIEDEQAATLGGVGEARASVAQSTPSAAGASTSLDPRLALWAAVHARLGLSPETSARFTVRARFLGTSEQAEILAWTRISEEAYFRAVAAILGVAFVESLDPDRLVVRDRDGIALLRSRKGPMALRYHDGQDAADLVFAPSQRDVERLAALLRARPHLRSRVKIATCAELRRALFRRVETTMLHRVRALLFDALPYCSARLVVSGPQGFVIGAFLTMLVGGLVLWPLQTIVALHLIATLFFFACVAIRLTAAFSFAGLGSGRLKRFDPSALPTYSVLVALRHEAAIVPQLLTALGRLWWPRGKLEIKLVCEADDAETIAAIEAHEMRSFVEIIKVPASEPRTKPKALAFALQACSGDFVVLYDAEDRPHPEQLLEAWQRFEKDGPHLACLQAPLHITNATKGMIPAMFAFEYAGLFRGLLPWLARHRFILPLGGTSNHFRRGVLENIGGWDPYNVTEDADLGLRLARFGYHTGTIKRPTYETAPEGWTVWRNQRTRWFKGWMQTWLVHMRHPIRLAYELGPASFIMAQILFAGMIVSALLHPLLIATLIYLLVDIVRGHEFDLLRSSLMSMDVSNIVFGYLAFLLLGRASATREVSEALWRIVLFTPVYWMMLSWAAWRALIQLCVDPYLWEKTPHPRPDQEDGEDLFRL